MDVDERILQAIQARADALVRQDAAALERLMHPLCRWTTYAGLVLDRDDYIRRNTTSVTFTSQRLTNPVVRVVGNTAVVSGTVVDHLASGEEFRLPITMTWVASEGSWQLLAGHAGPRI